ncbi:hypothetical protein F3N42_06080 [Marinihelvus fidelis]|uniref:DUF5666 domain-containing protein n=1 Tax=Marinihelvus fidelis TaxID=2613842 RepID=A0A5N0TCP7_9GAMM|nr:hypothetical protein [Marinihelvus fidelis]KAA9132775.1 hypothetical protein F3N42_06080 [Marinihelvus fidelis]
MNRFLNAAAALTLALPLTVLAGDPAEKMDRPSMSGSRTVTLEAEVAAIDHDTREVTLTGEAGESFSFVASDDVRNLDQVHVGDVVVAQMYEEISIEVFPNPDGLEPGYGDMTVEGRAEEGEAPGGMSVGTTVITAVVEDIDLEAGTYSLRGPEGNVGTFEAADPANLERAEVGDLVVMTVILAAGVLVESPDSE